MALCIVMIFDRCMPGAPSLRRLTGALNDFELSGAQVFGFES
jgi:hypothetical protein